ncbi:MAG TPA: hypothetical protein VGX25_22870 [Actinophytocola sp.]|uniref:hypothetical protein n=1 Tax=Actinophytocola sp. TaxID=1872138 RepID=UPI002DDD9A87|nr:hypothetical protein [Actinophytocola sp.]HEV2782244.1 hypothetical protein [Actinophytocola sp.]
MRARGVMPPHRAVRGWLLALASMALAVAAHGAAGGGTPEFGTVLPLTALLAWVGAVVMHRPRGVVPLTVLLGAIQLALHLLLTRVAGAHAHGAGPAAVDGWAMLAAHAAATVLTAALLVKASAALTLVSAALDWLRGQLAVLRSAPVPAPAAIVPTSAVPDRPGPLLEILLRRVRARRGPPASS